MVIQGKAGRVEIQKSPHLQRPKNRLKGWMELVAYKWTSAVLPGPGVRAAQRGTSDAAKALKPVSRLNPCALPGGGAACPPCISPGRVGG